MNFSIKDRLNCFGTTATPGFLENTIYVGRGGKSLTEKDYKGEAAQSQGEGGEIAQPYYAEFTADGDFPGEATLEVHGAPEAADAAGNRVAGDYSLVGSLVIPSGGSVPDGVYRVAVSGNTCKYFKARFTGASGPVVSAFLMRY